MYHLGKVFHRIGIHGKNTLRSQLPFGKERWKVFVAGKCAKRKERTKANEQPQPPTLSVTNARDYKAHIGLISHSKNA